MECSNRVSYIVYSTAWGDAERVQETVVAFWLASTDHVFDRGLAERASERADVLNWVPVVHAGWGWGGGGGEVRGAGPAPWWQILMANLSRSVNMPNIACVCVCVCRKPLIFMQWIANYSFYLRTQRHLVDCMTMPQTGLADCGHVETVQPKAEVCQLELIAYW